MTTFHHDPSMLPDVRLAGFVAYRKPWRHFRRTSNDIILYFVKSGTLELRENDTAFHLHRGDMLVLAPGRNHEGIRPECCEYWYVHFRHPSFVPVRGEPSDESIRQWILSRHAPSEFMADRSDSGSHPEHVRDTIDSVDSTGSQRNPQVGLAGFCPVPQQFRLPRESDRLELQDVLERMAEEFNRRDEQYRTVCALCLSDLLIRIARIYVTFRSESSGTAVSRAFCQVRGIMDHLQRHYPDPLTSACLEEEIGMSFDHMNRIFRQETGTTIFHHLNRIRIGHARELLGTGGIPLAEIAERVGIPDPFYFSKVFHRFTGESPSAYRKRIQGSVP